MDLELKKQFASFEEFEFKYEGFKSVAEVISEFNSFPWKEELKKSKELIEQHAQPSIHLKNSQHEKLSIYFEDTELFSLTYSTKVIIYRSLAAGGFGAEQVPDLITKFSMADTRGLRAMIRADPDHSHSPLLVDLLSIIFGKEKDRTVPIQNQDEFHFYVTAWQSLAKLSWSLLFLFMPIVIMLGTAGKKPINLNGFLFIQALITPFAIPGIVLFANYYKKNGRQRLVFKRGQNLFFVLSDEKKEVHDKKDFETRFRIESNANDAPWTSFEYSVLIKKDGTHLFLSNILIDNDDVDKQFGRIKEELKKKWVPTMPG